MVEQDIRERSTLAGWNKPHQTNSESGFVRNSRWRTSQFKSDRNLLFRSPASTSHGTRSERGWRLIYGRPPTDFLQSPQGRRTLSPDFVAAKYFWTQTLFLNWEWFLRWCGIFGKIRSCRWYIVGYWILVYLRYQIIINYIYKRMNFSK